jgi:hypothetical protein
VQQQSACTQARRDAAQPSGATDVELAVS